MDFSHEQQILLSGIMLGFFLLGIIISNLSKIFKFIFDKVELYLIQNRK